MAKHRVVTGQSNSLVDGVTQKTMGKDRLYFLEDKLLIQMRFNFLTDEWDIIYVCENLTLAEQRKFNTLVERFNLDYLAKKVLTFDSSQLKFISDINSYSLH